MSESALTQLSEPSPSSARHSLTSIPWPAERDDFPAIDGPHQIVRLFEEHTRPRLRRYLLLTHGELPPMNPEA